VAKMATLVALAAKETPGYFADYGGSFEVSEDTGRTFESKIHSFDLCNSLQLAMIRNWSLSIIQEAVEMKSS